MVTDAPSGNVRIPTWGSCDHPLQKDWRILDGEQRRIEEAPLAVVPPGRHGARARLLNQCVLLCLKLSLAGCVEFTYGV